MPLRVACQMDPIERIDIRGDSTFALLLEAQKRGHALFYYTPPNLALHGNKLLARGDTLKVEDKIGAHYKLSEPRVEDLSQQEHRKIAPTLIIDPTDDMKVMQEEIFGPVLSVTTFKDEADALAIANDTLYGLGAGVWSRNGTTAYRMGRAIQAGRVWTNCYHAYPAHAAFGGYKQSGIGRENHKMMLDHYQQTKNLLVSYSPKALGFF